MTVSNRGEDGHADGVTAEALDLLALRYSVGPKSPPIEPWLPDQV